MKEIKENWDWEKTIRDISQIHQLHPELIDEFVLIVRQAIAQEKQKLAGVLKKYKCGKHKKLAKLLERVKK